MSFQWVAPGERREKLHLAALLQALQNVEGSLCVVSQSSVCYRAPSSESNFTSESEGWHAGYLVSCSSVGGLRLGKVLY